MKEKIIFDIDELRRRAEKLFRDERYSCSEAVFVALAEAMGGSVPVDCVRLATGFRGGMGCGDVCGAVSGGVMALGLALAPPTPGGPSPELTEAVKRFRERFAQANGAIDCADLIREYPDKTDPRRRDFCTALVGSAAEAAAWLLENSQQLSGS